MKDGMRIAGGDGSITFPISTPGEMTRLRFGCNYRAREDKDGWDLQVSLDSGKTFTTVEHAAGSTGNGASKYVTFDKIPAGTKDALVRFAGTQLQHDHDLVRTHRQVDYKSSLAAGFLLPIQITYTWKENGQEKKDVHIAKSADETYVINCAEKPVMASIVLEVKP